ncbi:hypothetical protein N2152v2_009801 [Parachlorella kessleri]
MSSSLRHVLRPLLVLLALALAAFAQDAPTWQYEGEAATLTSQLQEGANVRTPATAFDSALVTPNDFSGFRAVLTSPTEGADLGLLCSSAAALQPPTPGYAEYQSDRFGTASEEVFISPRHHRADGTQLRNVICYVYNSGQAEANFSLSVQLVYNLTTDTAELAVADALHSRCCAGAGQCAGWDADATAGGTQPAGYDLCYARGSICTNSGQLTQLDLAGEGLECDFPLEEIPKFPELNSLFLQNNNLTGNMETIAISLGSLQSLTEVVLSNNTGISGWLSQASDGGVCRLPLQALSVLEVDGLGLEGSLPACLVGEASKLQLLSAEGSGLSGTLPEFATPSLQVLLLSKNDFTGSVPESLSRSGGLRTLDLSSNSLGNQLPDEWGSAPQLTAVSLAHNKLEGPVPVSLAAHPALLELDLSGNQLVQFVAGASDVEKSKLTDLSLAHNSLQDGLLTALYAYPALVTLNVSSSNLQGSLPAPSEGQLKSLLYLDLSSNGLTGTISPDWSSVGIFTQPAAHPAQLNVFDVADNKLNGNLPEFLGIAAGNTQARALVELQGNTFDNGCADDFANLAGVCASASPSPSTESPAPGESPVPSPEAQSPNPDAQSPTPPGGESPAPPPPDTTTGSGSDLSSGAIAAIVLSVLIACGIVAGLVVYVKRKRRHTQSDANIFGGNTRFEKFEDDFTQPSASLELAGGRQGRQDYGYKADPETP